jgi:AcrR family transcriptional regulator
VSPTTGQRQAARHLRRDAAQNRQHLLDAAVHVFAHDGLEASVEEIARVAGVGIGTLYRRFPTKDALIAELVQDMLDTLSGLATDAIQQPDGRGLEHYLEASCAFQAEHRGCLPRLWNADTANASLVQIRRMTADLLEDAKHHGRVRQDLSATDVTVVMWSIRGVIETTGDIAPNAWRRHLDLLIDGMRPAATPLSHRPLTRAQVNQLLASS